MITNNTTLCQECTFGCTFWDRSKRCDIAPKGTGPEGARCT